MQRGKPCDLHEQCAFIKFNVLVDLSIINSSYFILILSESEIASVSLEAGGGQQVLLKVLFQLLLQLSPDFVLR